MAEARIAIVTAASKGMGAASARELAARGYKVALMSRSEPVLRLAEELNGVAVLGSVTAEKDLAHLVTKTMATYRRNLPMQSSITPAIRQKATFSPLRIPTGTAALTCLCSTSSAWLAWSRQLCWRAPAPSSISRPLARANLDWLTLFPRRFAERRQTSPSFTQINMPNKVSA